MLTVEKGDELFAGPLGAQSEGDRAKAVNGIQAEKNIVVLMSSMVSTMYWQLAVWT